MQEYIPKISIIIPVYNVEKYLRECLDSVLNQTFKDFEVICINDGSTDGSLKLIEEYKKKDSRIVIVNQSNNGVSYSRNNGIELARGEYVYFLDADDYIEPELLELNYQKAIYTQCDIVCFGFTEHFGNKSKEGYPNSIIDTWDDNNFLPVEVVSQLIHCVWDKFYKKEFIVKNFITFPVGIKICEDGDFNMQCLINNAKWIALSNVLYHYRKDCLSSASNNMKYLVQYDIEHLKYFIKTKTFQEASFDNKRICLNKMITGIIDHSKRSNAKKYIWLYLTQFSKLTKYIESNINNNLLNTCSSYKVLKNLSATKYILQNIFSLKNEVLNNQKRKIITIFGLKIKFKKNNNRLMRKIMKNKINGNSILIIEANDCHNETIPSFIKYFHVLGFKVDILITERMFLERVYSNIDKKYYNNIFALNINQMQEFLESEKPSEYEYIFINSNRLYHQGTRTKPIKFFEFFHHITAPKKYFIKLEHHLEFLDEERVEEQKIVQLPDFDNGALFCNANYYGRIKSHTKNPITNFISVGEFKYYRRNIEFLFDSVKQLQKNNITNFKVTILTRKFNHIIPDDIKHFFEIKENLPFNQLFSEIEKADFFLTCLDPGNIEHNRYISTGTSGSFQLIYGFNIPCILENKFAAIHYFDDKNAILYKENSGLADALYKCITMNNSTYKNIKNELYKTTSKIREISLNNLQKSLISLPYKVVSLGYDCLPRTYSTHCNIKGKASQGEPCMPFDLCVTPTESLYEIIKNNFKDYISNLKYDRYNKYWKNKKYNILYNHDTDCKNSLKGKKQLVKRLKSRILNFKNSLNYDGYLYFIINNPTTEILINNIYKELNYLRNNKPFKLIVIDINAQLDIKKLRKEILIFNEKHPFEKHSDWWLKENKELNKQYENKFADFISKVINIQCSKEIKNV